MPTNSSVPRTGTASPMPLPRPGTPPRPRVPVPERTVLGNGLRVALVPWGSLPNVTLKLLLPAGAVHDPEGAPGLAGLTGRLLAEGTERFSAEALNARLDQLGASLDVHVEHDFAEIELFMLGETIDDSLELLAEVLVRPTFPAHELDRARHEVLDAIAARADEPANVADDRCATAVFGAGHPYGRPAIGTLEGVQSVAREQVEGFHAAAYRPAGGLLVAAGDFEPARLLELIHRFLGDWSGVPIAGSAGPVPLRAAQAPEQIAVAWRDAQQAEIRVGGTGMPRNSPDWIPAAVANYILGGSTITGRLGANLREDKGWTYGARSSFAAGLQSGGWVAETAVDVEVRDAALREMLDEIARIGREPVSDDELDRAKEALVLSLPRAFETPSRAVNRFVTVDAYGLAPDYWERFPDAVRAVSADEVQRTAARYFGVDNLVRLLVG
jgi:zinc protease